VTSKYLIVLATKRTHTHPFNGPLFRTTRVSRYQKGKTNLDFTGARDSEWPWHQLGHMQLYRSRQITTPAPHHSVFYRPDALPAAQPTASVEWRHLVNRPLLFFTSQQCCCFCQAVVALSHDVDLHSVISAVKFCDGAEVTNSDFMCHLRSVSFSLILNLSVLYCCWLAVEKVWGLWQYFARRRNIGVAR